MTKLAEKVSPIWIKQQLDYWREQLQKRPNDKRTRREYASIVNTARGLGITAESLIQKLLDGKSLEEIIDEVTKSGAIPGLPQPMAMVRDPRYTMADDDEDDEDERPKPTFIKARKRRQAGGPR